MVDHRWSGAAHVVSVHRSSGKCRPGREYCYRPVPSREEGMVPLDCSPSCRLSDEFRLEAGCSLPESSGCYDTIAPVHRESPRSRLSEIPHAPLDVASISYGSGPDLAAGVQPSKHFLCEALWRTQSNGLDLAVSSSSGAFRRSR